MINKGDRVTTPSGPGTIVSMRMAPPSYSLVEAYCVCLDSKKAEAEKPPFRTYSGTMFKAELVVPQVSAGR
jgi:hypothetical protein